MRPHTFSTTWGQQYFLHCIKSSCCASQNTLKRRFVVPFLAVFLSDSAAKLPFLVRVSSFPSSFSISPHDFYSNCGFSPLHCLETTSTAEKRRLGSSNVSDDVPSKRACSKDKIVDDKSSEKVSLGACFMSMPLRTRLAMYFHTDM